MILLKLFYFFEGYVIIRERALSTVRLINTAHSNGIFLWNVTPTEAYIKKRDLARLTELAERNGLSVEVIKAVSFYDRFIKNRGWLFLISATVAVCLGITASGYIWRIEINGCTEQVADEIIQLLKREGLSIGAKKSSLPSGNHLKDSIIYKLDGVGWAWVYLNGITARIEVSSDKLLPPVLSEAQPCNICAAKDGIISYISAEKGRAILTCGAYVSAGDIVISGAMPAGEKTPPYTVHAKGKVYAETLYTKSKTVSLYKSYTDDTGREYVRRTFRFFGFEIPISRQKPPFDEYRTETDITPFGICSYRHIETATEKRQIPEEFAVEAAREALYEEISAELSGGASKIFEEIHTERLTEDNIKVTLSMSFIENIAAEAKIDPRQMEELTNDTTN